ncbi:hypothetical protein EJ04DRAFT_523900 [Polyplosphaeria fusca]|uniref:Uncharacterized protein n=1 Tax=Polyplosphaeria fusca TaxID=682080 RepID=A0A9P4V2I7_9PLEO|nr:hypothetical protein EJ04DRAFT_523900 [Polyplosphaeria fusca]
MDFSENHPERYHNHRHSRRRRSSQNPPTAASTEDTSPRQNHRRHRFPVPPINERPRRPSPNRLPTSPPATDFRRRYHTVDASYNQETSYEGIPAFTHTAPKKARERADLVKRPQSPILDGLRNANQQIGATENTPTSKSVLLKRAAESRAKLELQARGKEEHLQQQNKTSIRADAPVKHAAADKNMDKSNEKRSFVQSEDEYEYASDPRIHHVPPVSFPEPSTAFPDLQAGILKLTRIDDKGALSALSSTGRRTINGNEFEEVELHSDSDDEYSEDEYVMLDEEDMLEIPSEQNGATRKWYKGWRQ